MLADDQGADLGTKAVLGTESARWLGFGFGHVHPFLVRFDIIHTRPNQSPRFVIHDGELRRIEGLAAGLQLALQGADDDRVQAALKQEIDDAHRTFMTPGDQSSSANTTSAAACRVMPWPATFTLPTKYWMLGSV